jgi:hypothetical protein
MSEAKGGAEGGVEPTEEELREAFEEQLRHITAADIIVQSAVSLINLAGRRLGLAEGGEGERDLGQVRDAIDGVRGLLPVIERDAPAAMVGQLRDALSALQLEYTKLAGAPRGKDAPAAAKAPAADASAQSAPGSADAGAEEPVEEGQGPAQRSGRLWVPGS